MKKHLGSSSASFLAERGIQDDVELRARKDRGHEPALAFMQSLTGSKRRAIGVAINE